MRNCREPHCSGLICTYAVKSFWWDEIFGWLIDKIYNQIDMLLISIEKSQQYSFWLDYLELSLSILCKPENSPGRARILEDDMGTAVAGDTIN